MEQRDLSVQATATPEEVSGQFYSRVVIFLMTFFTLFLNCWTEAETLILKDAQSETEHEKLILNGYLSPGVGDSTKLDFDPQKYQEPESMILWLIHC